VEHSTYTFFIGRERNLESRMRQARVQSSMNCCKAVEESPSPTNRGKGDKHRLYTGLTAVQVDYPHANGPNKHTKQASKHSSKRAAMREERIQKTRQTRVAGARPKDMEYTLASLTE